MSNGMTRTRTNIPVELWEGVVVDVAWGRLVDMSCEPGGQAARRQHKHTSKKVSQPTMKRAHKSQYTERMINSIDWLFTFTLDYQWEMVCLFVCGSFSCSDAKIWWRRWWWWEVEEAEVSIVGMTAKRVVDNDGVDDGDKGEDSLQLCVAFFYFYFY